jgi:hypothetical protein
METTERIVKAGTASSHSLTDAALQAQIDWTIGAVPPRFHVRPVKGTDSAGAGRSASRRFRNRLHDREIRLGWITTDHDRTDLQSPGWHNGGHCLRQIMNRECPKGTGGLHDPSHRAAPTQGLSALLMTVAAAGKPGW